MAAVVAGSHAAAQGLKKSKPGPLSRFGDFMREQSEAGKEMAGKLGLQARLDENTYTFLP